MTRLKLLALGLALAAMMGAGFYLKSLQAERDRLALAAAAAQQQAASLSRELTLSWQALQAREAAQARLAEETANLKQQLKEVYDHDAEASDWARRPVPDAVLDRLRR